MSANRLTLLPLAEADIESITDYVTDHAGMSLALAYMARLREAMEMLLQFPQAGAPRPFYGDGVRLLAFERRIAILYRVSDGDIMVLRILSGGQDASEMRDN